MDRKTSAHYQRQYRQRLREQGLVKKEIWILPEHGARLQQLETQMRQPHVAPRSLTTHREEDSMENRSSAYRTIADLTADLRQSQLAQSEKLRLEVIEGADPSLMVTLPEFGDLPVHVAISGEQLVMEAFMWPADQVRDSAGLNAQILRLQKLFPSCTMALGPMTQGAEGYVMFSAMRTSSSRDDVLAGVLLLADSVLQATEALTSYLPSLDT